MKTKIINVMFKKECKFLLIILCTIIISQDIFAQKSSWKMQPVAIQTRWAKDVNPDNVLPDYPRPQMLRKEWQNLNGLWEYAITPIGPNMPSKFEGQILVPFPIESALSGVKKLLLPNQLLWYKRTISKPNTAVGKHVILHFGAVDWQATVYVNGKAAGIHNGGYTAFNYDITNLLKSGDNELVVKVYDPTNQGIGPHGKQVLNPSNIYYTPSSGIWQTVWLETVPAAHITDLKFTPDIDEEKLDLTINLSSIIPTSSIVIPAQAGVSIEAIVFRDGKEILKQVQDDSEDNSMALKIPNARLWSPDDPFLYDLVVRLKKNGKVVDEVKSYFGMRKIAISKDEKGVDRIFLNNKYTYNLGTLDQGFWPDGLYTAPTDEALSFDIKAIKAMGFNTIRKHIKVEPARWYYHADQIGMLVWQDFVNPNQGLPMGAKQAFEVQVKETMEQLHNYPSIITWVIFNEKWGQYDQKRITDWVKGMDRSRLVNGHSGEYLYVNSELRSPSPNAYVGADITDVHSYPNPMISIKQSGKAQACGEFGGIGVPIEGHLWDDLVTGWGYDGVVTPKQMESQYKKMIDTLVRLEKEGMSASIYTQPFDVESEQNGLLTYDRSIIKIPLEIIRGINANIWHVTTNYLSATSSLKVNIADSKVKDYATRLKEYKNGRKDSAFLRTLTIMATDKNDQEVRTETVNDYIRLIKDPFAEINLRFVYRFTKSSKDSGFSIIFNNITKVNSQLGSNKAENLINRIIGVEEIDPFVKDPSASPNWEKISKLTKDKYGSMGEEKVYGVQMLYYKSKKDWVNFGKYYALYYETALGHSEYHINNISWTIFEKVNDPDVLRVAVSAAKFSMENFAKDDPADIDTYANLLYKIGRNKDAIEWERRAVKLSNNEAIYVERLNKMENGTPTWGVPASDGN